MIAGRWWRWSWASQISVMRAEANASRYPFASATVTMDHGQSDARVILSELWSASDKL